MTNFEDNSPNTVIYALFDTVAGSNIQYFPCCNDETAIRMIKDSALDPKSFAYQHRNDLVLYRIFEYAPKSGESVLNRKAIYSLSALPEYDDTPFGLDKIQDSLNAVLTQVSELRNHLNVVNKLQEDNKKLLKEARISFIDKLFKGKKEIDV